MLESIVKEVEQGAIPDAFSDDVDRHEVYYKKASRPRTGQTHGVWHAQGVSLNSLLVLKAISSKALHV